MSTTSLGEVSAAVDAAARAQTAWADRSLKDRYRALQDLADRVLERADAIADIIGEETGKSSGEALLNEVSGIGQYIDVAYKEAKAALRPQKPSLSRVAYPGKKALIRPVPRGVVGIIAPWNYPFSIFYKPLFPALFAGNAVVLKPSEYTPRTGAWLAAQCAEVLGPDLVQVVQGKGEVGQALIDNVDAITFTGSVATGKKVAARAAERLIPASVELGGNDAAIVLDDCRLERTLAGIAHWSLHNCGQNCGAIERLYVDQAIADDFLPRLANLFDAARVYPNEPHSDLGLMQNEDQLQIVADHVQDALERGATLLAGGEPTYHPLGYRPTLLADCTEDMKVMRQETFGPVLASATVSGAGEAISRANDSPYGLNASIWTTDLSRGQTLARELDVGIASLNNHAIAGSMANIPWTGTGDTGTGIAASRFSYHTFCRRQTIFVDKNKKPDPFWMPFDDDSLELANALIDYSRGSLSAGLQLAGAARRRLKTISQWVKGDPS